MEKPHDTYICYNGKELEKVKPVVEGLKGFDINAWFDSSNMRNNRSVTKEMAKNLQLSKTITVFIGKSGIGDIWQDGEIDIGDRLVKERKGNFFMICVLLDNVDDIPNLDKILEPYPDLRNLPRIEMNKNETHPFARLISAIHDKKLEEIIVEIEGINKQKSEKLNQYREYYLEGDYYLAYDSTLALSSDKQFYAFNESLKANILTDLAKYEIIVHGNQEKAEQIINKARELSGYTEDKIYKCILAQTNSRKEEVFQNLEVINSTEELNYKLKLFLLYNESFEKINAELEKYREEIPFDTTTKAIDAFVHFYFEKDEEAQSILEVAKVENPKWKWVRYIEALIEYFSSISKQIRKLYMNIHPTVVNPEHLKQDKESRIALENAREIFADLAKKYNTSKYSKENFHRSEMQQWELACLCILPDKKLEAENLAKSILEVDTLNFPVIKLSYANGLNIQIDRQKILNSFLVRKPNMQEIAILVESSETNQDLKDSVKLLEKYEEIFKEKENNAGDYWNTLMARVFLELKEIEKAEEYCKSIPDINTRLGLEFIITQERARVAQDWKILEKFLEVAFTQTQNPFYSYYLYLVKIRLREYDYIISKKEELMNYRTIPALHILISSAEAKKDWSLCIDAIQLYKNLSDELPENIKLLESIAKYQMGEKVEASSDAEKNYQASKNLSSLQILLNISLKENNKINVIKYAKDLLEIDEAPSHYLLYIANSIHTFGEEGKDIAQKLWRKAKTIGFEDSDSVTFAYTLAFELNLEKELDYLNQKVWDIAREGKGNIRLVDIEGAISLMQKNQKQFSELYQTYEKGEGSIYNFAFWSNRFSIAEIYYKNTEDNRNNSIFLNKYPIYNTNTRLLNTTIPTEKSLRMDFAAILMADYLEIFDQLTKVFSPILISSDIDLVFEKEITNLTHHQPSAIDRAKYIVDNPAIHKSVKLSLLNDTPLDQKEFEKLITTENAFFIDYFDNRLNNFNKEHLERVISFRDIIDSIQSEVSDEDFSDSCNSLGKYKDQVTNTHPPKRASLYFLGNTFSVIYGTSLFREISSKYEIFVDRNYANEEIQSFREQEKKEEVIKKLRKLQRSIQQKKDAGIIKLLPFKEDAVDSEKKDPYLKSLAVILAVNLEKENVWIDDRFLQSQSLNIKSSIDILYILKNAKQISESIFFANLFKLRTANFKYISLDSIELLYQIKATISTSKKFEKINIIAQYYSSCLLSLESSLKRKQRENSQYDYTFLVQSKSAIETALIKIWTDSSLEKEKENISDWIILKLYSGVTGTFHLVQPTNKIEMEKWISEDIASLLLISFWFLDKKNKLRVDYFNWLSFRILNNRFKLNPNLIPVVAENLWGQLNLLEKEFSESGKDKEYNSLLISYILDLPSDISNILVSRLPESEWYEIITINQLRFHVKEFYKEIKKVIDEGKASSISDLDLKKEYRLSKKDKFLFLTIENKDIQLENSFFLLSEKKETLEETVHVINKELEQSDFQMQKFKEDILKEEIGSKRISLAQENYNKDTFTFYYNLNLKIRKQLEFTLDELIPIDLDRYLFYITEPHKKERKQVLKDIGQAIEQKGFEEILLRILGFPGRLPKLIIREFNKKDDNERRNLVNSLLSQCTSPIGTIHLTYLLLSGGVDDKKAAINLLIKFFTEPINKSVFKLFQSILLFIDYEFCIKAKFKGYRPDLKLLLVWLHSSRIHSMFCQPKADIEMLTSIFTKKMETTLTNQALDRDDDYWNDVCNPRRLEWERFVVYSLAFLSRAEPRLMENSSIKNLLNTILIKKNEAGDFLSILFYQDTNLLKNNLGSILGKDLTQFFNKYFSKTVITDLTIDTKKGMVQDSLMILHKDITLTRAWLSISLILGDQDIYLEHKKSMNLLLSNNEIQERIKDTELQIVYIRIVSSLSKYVDDVDLKQKLRDDLSVISINLLSKTSNDSEYKQILHSTIEAYYNVSVVKGEPEQSSENFFYLIEKLLSFNPKSANYLLYLLQRMTTELPLNQISHIYKSLLLARVLYEDN
ncbi:MAG: toll/interleukin-1 receptor domain-containing protein [Leptospiraceae bacterium]|nr:toll/interleukin-1 receptor domain-containing protein [Leptospiraceae bacterium]